MNERNEHPGGVMQSTCKPLLALTYWNMSPPSTNSMAIARYSGVRNACARRRVVSQTGTTSGSDQGSDA